MVCIVNAQAYRIMKITCVRRLFSGDNPVNILSIFAAFHIGSTGYDIGKVLGMIGIIGARLFEQNFSRHSPKITEIIREVSK